MENKPLHIADKDRSTFVILKYENFKTMAASDLQALMLKKNIVVTNVSHDPNVKFDECSLCRLSPLQAQVSRLRSQFKICSHSLLSLVDLETHNSVDYATLATSSRKCSPLISSGKTGDLLQNARDPNGKILNGLEFPMWNANMDPNSYAADLIAWDFTRGKLGCGRDISYPIQHIRWGLAGTAKTMTFLHIDSDGFSTFLSVQCGLKVWGVYRERPEKSLSSIGVFLDEGFCLDEIDDLALFDLEAIVLRPGNLL